MKINLKNLIREKPLILGALIFIIAFTLRFLAALKIAWRPDEIVYVDWIGTWFSEHFFGYFFQFYHKIFPPQSPAFGNPPLSMWVMSLGIWIAKLFHGSSLLGARMVNVIIGSLTCFTLYNFGRRWFNLRVGIIAGISFALIPVVLTNSATAYLETLLILLVILSINYLLRFFETNQKKYLFFCTVLLGLAFLTKYIVIPFILVMIVWIPIIAYKKQYFWRNYLISLLLLALTPIILWSGLRDPTHIGYIYWMYKEKIYNPYIISYNFPVFQYYYLMLLGILPPVITLSAIFGIILLFRNIIRNNWKNFQKEILILLLIIVYLAYNSIFARYSGANQILPIIPLIIIFAAISIDKIFLYFKNKYFQYGIALIILVLLVLPLTSYKIQFWSLYNSSIIKTNNAFRHYIVGLGGEEVPEVADYINNNTPKDARVAIIAYDWQLKKYLKDNRTDVPLFLNEGAGGALARSADYFVLPRTYTETIQGGAFEEILKIEPLYTIREKGIILARIYQANYSNVNEGDVISLDEKNWKILSQNNKPQANFSDGKVQVNYKFDKEFPSDGYQRSEVKLENQENFMIDGKDGIYAQIYGDGKNKNISFVLTGEDKSTLTFGTSFEWLGWKNVFIPSTMFVYSNGETISSNPNIKQKYNLDIIINSIYQIEGMFEIKDIKVANVR